MQQSKELYYHTQGLPSPRPFTVLEPHNRSKNQSSPAQNSGSKGFRVAAEVERIKAGEARSEQTINQVAEKDRLIDFLKTEMNLVRENYRRQAEEFQLVKVSEASHKQRIRSLESELDTEKERTSKL